MTVPTVRTAATDTRPAVTVRFRTRLAVIFLATNILIVGLIQSVLPRMALDVSSEQTKQTALSIILIVGTIGCIFGNPLFGALSDRTSSRFGRRRPWILLGGLAAAALTAVLPFAHTVAALAILWLLIQATINATLGGAQAVIPDQVPVRQRATVTGWTGAAQSVGSIIAVAMLSYVVLGTSMGSWAIATLTAVLIVIAVARMNDPSTATQTYPPFAWRPFLRDFWIDPRKHPDFAWAWAARFAFSLGAWLGTTYLLFYVTDRTGLDSAGALQAHTLLVTVNIVTLVSSAVLFGYWSDRVQRRKIFLMFGSASAALGALLLGLTSSLPVMLLAAALIGLGFGAYMGNDQALVTQVLPSDEDRGRALGVFNIALSLPQLFAPIMGAVIFAVSGGQSNGYTLLFAVASIAILAGGGLAMNVRDVR
jgi:MFS family permease